MEIKETIIDDIYTPQEIKAYNKRAKVTYDEFCDILGHHFQRAVLLKRALTHSSFSKNRLENNERLEFLGDRVLGLSVAKILYDMYSLEDEGALAIRHAVLVSMKTLAQVAEEIKISDLLELSPQEMKRKGFKNKNILADSVEAVLGAIYLDSDFDTAFSIIERIWGPIAERAKEPMKDFKTKLQEYTQKNFNNYPKYSLVKKDGPAHSPTFTMTATVNEITATAEGSSKKEAEQLVAKQIIEQLGIPIEEEDKK
jgi:ribonuclease-3